MKSVLRAVVAFVALSAALLLISLSLMDKYLLSSFARQLVEAPMPDNTYIIENAAICGKLYGTNGEHMDFLACILVKSALPISTLQKHFSEIAFSPVKKASKKYGDSIVKIEVSEVKGAKLSYSNLEHENILFKSLENTDDFSGYYTVVIFDDGYY